MDGPLDGINFNQVCNNEIKVLLCSLRGRRLSFSCASFFTRSLRVHWKCQVILVHFAASTVEVQYYGKQQQQQRQPSPPTRLRPRHTWPSHSRAARAIKWSEASPKALKMKPGSSGRVEMWRGRDICKRGGGRKGPVCLLRFQMNSGYATWPLSDIAEHHAAPTAKKNKTKARTQTCTHKCADSEKAGRTLL